MTIHDKAHELANELKRSSEFISYKEKHVEIMKNQDKKEKIDDYRQKLMDYQIKVVEGSNTEDDLKKLQTLQQALVLDSDIREYLIAEGQFMQIYEDILKIIGQAIEINE